jgi:Zn-dependent protease with chaperone function
VVGYAAGALLASWRARREGDVKGALFLRALPGAGGLVAGLGLALPAFLRFEPQHTELWPGFTGLVLGLAGVLLLKASLLRGLRAWGGTVRLTRDWRRQAEALDLPSAPAPAFALSHPFPVVAVVGILRPRLFLARQVIASLTPAELQAVLAHEGGHLAAWDNLKRLLLSFLPTWGWRRLADRLERQWEAEAEARADQVPGPEAAVDLASALVKVARLAPPGARLGLPIAAFHAGEGIAGRVRDLVDEKPALEAARSGRWGRAAGLLLGALAVAAGAAALPLVHELSEVIVHLP